MKPTKHQQEAPLPRASSSSSWRKAIPKLYDLLLGPSGSETGAGGTVYLRASGQGFWSLRFGVSLVFGVWYSAWQFLAQLCFLNRV
jgi:hypothetical protein